MIPVPDLPAVTRAGWQCPECRTMYSPDVRQCDCAAVKRSLAEHIAQAPVTFGGSCTCLPDGLGTARCPVHQGALPNVVCTCASAWGAIIPPPPCPAHGQAEMLRVTC